MATTRVFSTEDGNLQSSIVTTRTRKYRDIDLAFANRPSGDIYKKTDAAAVKQAVKNILLTNTTEKPFQPYYGGDLSRFLFSLTEDFDADDMRDNIIASISAYEPRAKILNVDIMIFEDRNDVKVTVEFQVISTSEVVSVDVSLARLR